MKKHSKIIITILVIATALLLVFKSKSLLPFKKPFDSYQFLSQLKDKIVQENWLKTEDYTKLTLKKEEGKFAGFDWINKDNQVELVKGYFLNYSPFGNNYTLSDPAIVDGAEKIKSYLLSEGFKLNSQNSYFDETEGSFWEKEEGSGGRLGFEKGTVKCFLTPLFLSFASSGFNFACGDTSESTTPSVYQEIYALVNPKNDLKINLTIDNHIDNFAVGGVSSGIGGAASLWKEQEGKWQSIDTTQMAWNCQILIDNKVPPSLFQNPNIECLYYDQPGQNFQNYSKLYQENFGQ